MRKGKEKNCERIAQLLMEEENEKEKVQRELREQIEKETKNPCEFQYLEKIMLSRRGGMYKSGAIDGKQVMTYDDYTRLIVNESRIPQYGKGQGECESNFVRPATVYQVRISGKGVNEDKNTFSSVETVIDSDGLSLSRTEISDTTRFGALIRFINEWFPAMTIIKPSLAARRRTASPLAGSAWVLIFILVLALPVIINTMKINVTSSINNNRNVLNELKAEEALLEADYEASIDLRKIDAIARNELGMVHSSDATINLLILNQNDKIETFDDKESTGLLPALLSALGIRVGE